MAFPQMAFPQMSFRQMPFPQVACPQLPRATPAPAQEKEKAKRVLNASISEGAWGIWVRPVPSCVHKRYCTVAGVDHATVEEIGCANWVVREDQAPEREFKGGRK